MKAINSLVSFVVPSMKIVANEFAKIVPIRLLSLAFFYLFTFPINEIPLLFKHRKKFNEIEIKFTQM